MQSYLAQTASTAPKQIGISPERAMHSGQKQPVDIASHRGCSHTLPVLAVYQERKLTRRPLRSSPSPPKLNAEARRLTRTTNLTAIRARVREIAIHLSRYASPAKLGSFAVTSKSSNAATSDL